MQRVRCVMWMTLWLVICFILAAIFRTNTISGLPYMKMVKGQFGRTMDAMLKVRNPDKPEVVKREVVLTEEEKGNMKVCVDNKDQDLKAASGQFWSGDVRSIRISAHTYLTNQSIVIDIGGNVGEDAQAFISKYNSRLVIFEPLQMYYSKLKARFSGNPKVKILDIGLGKKDADLLMEVMGQDGDASSLYRGNTPTTGEKVKIKNTTRVLGEIGLGTFPIDLLHIDCEGCELDVLEALVYTNIIFNLKHIQFATHTQYPGVGDLASRYCSIQEVLKRTHKPLYQYKFVWEGWQLK